jgi:hypothetical protein
MGIRAIAAVLVIVVAAGLAACAPTAERTSPAGASPAGASAAPEPRPPSAAPTDATAPTGVLPFPTMTGEVLAAGRYAGSPPFDIPLTFEVPATGWESMHLHGEFLDIGRFATAERNRAPARWIAWAHPDYVRGAADEAVEDLTPAAAAELLASRDDLTATEPTAFSLDGREGVRLDLHASQPDTVLFGGPDGNFGLEPSTDVRLGFVPIDDGLLLFLVLAAPDELEAAWEEAQPVLDSVEL